MNYCNQTDSNINYDTATRWPVSHCQYEKICGHPPFKYEKAKINHEKKVHNCVSDKKVTENSQKFSIQKEDYKKNYIKSSSSYNSFLRSINDPVREGDGARLMELYRIALLFFKCYGHTRYGLTLAKLFFRMRYQPESRFKLTWQRFINTSGKKGHNISRDLHLEHLNGFLKELLKSLRSNINEENARRIANGLGNMKKIVDNTETNLAIKTSKSYRKNYSKDDVIKLANEIKTLTLFQTQNDREFPSFPAFSSNLLEKLDMSKLLLWLHEYNDDSRKLYTTQNI